MSEISRLKARVNVLTKLVLTQTVVFALILFTAAKKAEPIVDTIRAHHLVVVDQRGIQRVHIGAPVPDPIIEGHVIKRDEPAAGVMIYDATGNERGGYITDNNPNGGNALITLDNLKEQAVTFVAYPQSGAEAGLKLDKEHYVALSATRDTTGIRTKNGTLEVAGVKLIEPDGTTRQIAP